MWNLPEAPWSDQLDNSLYLVKLRTPQSNKIWIGITHEKLRVTIILGLLWFTTSYTKRIPNCPQWKSRSPPYECQPWYKPPKEWICGIKCPLFISFTTSLLEFITMMISNQFQFKKGHEQLTIFTSGRSPIPGRCLETSSAPQSSNSPSSD